MGELVINMVMLSVHTLKCQIDGVLNKQGVGTFSNSIKRGTKQTGVRA